MRVSPRPARRLHPLLLCIVYIIFSPALLTRTSSEHEMFRNIPISSFYHKSWTAKDVAPTAPINALIKRFNTVRCFDPMSPALFLGFHDRSI